MHKIHNNWKKEWGGGSATKGISLVLKRHLQNNYKLYIALLMVLLAGISAGVFTVNGLSVSQKDELSNYFKGFLNLFTNQKIDNAELFTIAFIENFKIVVVLWLSGVAIIGIPIIFAIIMIKGFITGFSLGLILQAIGSKGVLFNLLALIPKELIITPCMLALGVIGINFSLSIIKAKSVKPFPAKSLRTDFLAYCVATLFFSGIIFVGVLVEAYVTPVAIRMMF